MVGDGETVIPSLPEPGMWLGMASANVWGPLRWKRAKIHRGSRRRTIEPHQEAGYTSAVVTVELNLAGLLQSGGVHIRHMMRWDGGREPILEACWLLRDAHPMLRLHRLRAPGDGRRDGQKLRAARFSMRPPLACRSGSRCHSSTCGAERSPASWPMPPWHAAGRGAWPPPSPSASGWRSFSRA